MVMLSASATVFSYMVTIIVGRTYHPYLPNLRVTISVAQA